MGDARADWLTENYGEVLEAAQDRCDTLTRRLEVSEAALKRSRSRLKMALAAKSALGDLAKDLDRGLAAMTVARDAWRNRETRADSGCAAWCMSQDESQGPCNCPHKLDKEADDV